MVNDYFPKNFDEENLDSYLRHLSRRWVMDGNSLKHEFDFDNFLGSMEFVNKVAELAQKFDHHPNIYIYYNKVIIELFTHKTGTVTKKDFELAKQIESLLKGTRSQS